MVKNHNRIRRVGIFVLIGLLIISILAAPGGLLLLKSNKIVLGYADLGMPYRKLYADEQVNSRLADDLAVFDGKLYVGGGDYNANTGPVYVMSYDLEKAVWEQSEEPLYDEQIKRFRLLDGKLISLGTDPKDDWNMGNYYILENGAWETLRVLPSGIHCFDAAEYGGDIFFGLGVNSGDFPAVRFDGAEYLTVEFRKDGAPLDTSDNEIIRVYNFFTHKGELFAFLTLDKTDGEGNKTHYMDLYRYDGESFVFLHGSLPAEDMPEVITAGGRVYFVLNRTLLVTEDLINFSVVSLGEGISVSDIISEDGKIYVLGWRKISGSYYEAMVFEGDSQGFDKKFGLLARATAGAFCKDGDTFYISLGEREQPANIRDMGRVVGIKVK